MVTSDPYNILIQTHTSLSTRIKYSIQRKFSKASLHLKDSTAFWKSSTNFKGGTDIIHKKNYFQTNYLRQSEKYTLISVYQYRVV